MHEYQETTLHAKPFVVDGQWVSIGTMNFDNRSLALNDGSTLMVLDSDCETADGGCISRGSWPRAGDRPGWVPSPALAGVGVRRAANLVTRLL